MNNTLNLFFLSVLPHVLGGAAARHAHRRPRLGQQPQKDRQGVVCQNGQNGTISFANPNYWLPALFADFLSSNLLIHIFKNDQK